jgi:hypothetical protein
MFLILQKRQLKTRFNWLAATSAGGSLLDDVPSGKTSLFPTKILSNMDPCCQTKAWEQAVPIANTDHEVPTIAQLYCIEIVLTAKMGLASKRTNRNWGGCTTQELLVELVLKRSRI